MVVVSESYPDGRKDGPQAMSCRKRAISLPCHRCAGPGPAVGGGCVDHHVACPLGDGQMAKGEPRVGQAESERKGRREPMLVKPAVTDEYAFLVGLVEANARVRGPVAGGRLLSF